LLVVTWSRSACHLPACGIAVCHLTICDLLASACQLATCPSAVSLLLVLRLSSCLAHDGPMNVGHLGVCHLVDVNWLAISRAASLLVVAWQLRNCLPLALWLSASLVFSTSPGPSSLLLVALVLVLWLLLRAC